MSRPDQAAANELCPKCRLPVLGGDVDERDPSWVCHCPRGASAACVPRAEYERVCEQRDKLLARLEADPERAAVAALDGLRKVWTEDDAQAVLILDWIGVAGGLSLAERVRILALELATKQGYSLGEAERLCPSAEVARACDGARRRCWPWSHDWRISRVTVPLFDISAKGILKTCRRYGKRVAK